MIITTAVTSSLQSHNSFHFPASETVTFLVKTVKMHFSLNTEVLFRPMWLLTASPPSCVQAERMTAWTCHVMVELMTNSRRDDRIHLLQGSNTPSTSEHSSYIHTQYFKSGLNWMEFGWREACSSLQSLLYYQVCRRITAACSCVDSLTWWRVSVANCS